MRDVQLMPSLQLSILGGADDIFVIGGVQAVAAMALGTESIPAVDMGLVQAMPMLQKPRDSSMEE
ncbi:MAG: hypothetical protein Ct9H300mP28_10200 [Pseudomonadota bacterium]|nr:MAG: hypothetical protein Ct9H300mP28_10200 [Pseudomonadota bacterium]